MFDITLEMQRFLMFVPILNIIHPLVWINNCYYFSYSEKTFWSGLLYGYLHCLPFAILQFLLSQFVPGIADFTGYLIMYLSPLTFGYGLVRFQENHFL